MAIIGVRIRWALFGRPGVYMLRTQLSIFDANAPAEGIPQVQQVGDDPAFVLLRLDPARQQTRTDTALDARDLRLDERALAVAIFVAKRMDALFLKCSPQSGRASLFLPCHGSQHGPVAE
ncbi:hypothetical protein [Paraburkholderia sp. RL17-373-BIF-A]|uniref:hypothetical protein n=1 Tax=Paraburkholderia sp. RL17-373-BIF-A TaxID=3031629 RepID=UPI0038B96571